MPTQQDRIDRAQRRAAPHLDAALSRIVEHGIAPADAAQAMIVFGAGALASTLTPAGTRAGILQARDLLFRWMTEVATKAAAEPPQRH